MSQAIRPGYPLLQGTSLWTAGVEDVVLMG